MLAFRFAELHAVVRLGGGGGDGDLTGPLVDEDLHVRREAQRLGGGLVEAHRIAGDLVGGEVFWFRVFSSFLRWFLPIFMDLSTCRLCSCWLSDWFSEWTFCLLMMRLFSVSWFSF